MLSISFTVFGTEVIFWDKRTAQTLNFSLDVKVVPIKERQHCDIIICSVCNPLDLRFDAFMDYSIPEILRVPLEELCLHIMVNK